jgi:hypothetical protein
MTPLDLGIGPRRIDDLLEMPNRASQPRWIQPGGRFQEHRFGLGGQGAGRSLVPWATTAAWAAEICPVARAAAVPARGPRNNARAVRTERAAAPAAIRSRFRRQLAVEGAATP